MYCSPVSNISPARISIAMSRSDSRDSQFSVASFTSAPMEISYSMSPSTFKSTSSTRTSATRVHRDSLSSGWLPSPYQSCMAHRSSSTQGYESSSTSSYISDDDLLALDDLPIEYIPNPTSAPRQQPASRRELTTEEQIEMLREMQEREQAQLQQQRQRLQQQKSVRFATEQRQPRRPSGLQRRTTAHKRS